MFIKQTNIDSFKSLLMYLVVENSRAASGHLENVYTTVYIISIRLSTKYNFITNEYYL